MTQLEDLGRRIATLEKALGRQQRASRLGSASLDDTALTVRGPGGTLRGILGQQADGTTALTVVNGGPPPAPSTPTVAPALGGISVTWDGTFAGGAVTPLDWSRVEVHASPTAGFTPDPTTVQATVETPQGATVYLAATDPQYVVLLARNTSGTASPASAQAGPYAPRTIVDTDVADGSITETKIASDAVTTPKIKAGAVQTAELDALAVTTAKLAVGSVDAVALSATAITGKTITGGTVTGAVVQTSASGARAVLDSAAGALEIYDADGHRTNYVGGEDNLIWNHAGWDEDGTPNGEWVAMQVGNFLMGVGNAADPDDRDQSLAGLLGVLAVGFGAVWQSPAKATGMTKQAVIRLMAGTASGASGTLNYPAAQIDGDIAVKGVVVKQTATFDSATWRNVPEKRKAPTMGTGWASGPVSGGGSYPPLQFWTDAHDNLRVFGCFRATSTSPNNIIATGMPLVNINAFSSGGLGGVGVGGAAFKIGASNVQIPLYVNEMGQLRSAGVPTFVVNDTFEVNATIPLGNIA